MAEISKPRIVQVMGIGKLESTCDLELGRWNLIDLHAEVGCLDVLVSE